MSLALGRGVPPALRYLHKSRPVVANCKLEIGLRALASHYLKNFRDTGLTAPTDTAGENSGGGPASWRWQAAATYDGAPFSATLTAGASAPATIIMILWCA